MDRDVPTAERSIHSNSAEDRYRLVFENSLVGVFTVSEDRRIMEINPRACEIFGLQYEDAVGRSIADVHVSPAHYERFGEAVFSQIVEAGVSNVQYPLRRRSGEIFWAELSGKPINGHNRDDGVVWVLVDISRAKAAEIALRESEERYSLAVAGASDGLWDWKIPTNEIYFSPRWKEIIGFRDDEIPNCFDAWQQRVHPQDVDSAFGAIQAHLRGETEHMEIEFRMRHKDGSWCWILARGKCVRDATGLPMRMAGSHTDIDARKRVESQLQENRKRLETVFSTVQTGIAIVDHEQRIIVDANEKAAEILGVELDDLLGHRCSDWFCSDSDPCPFAGPFVPVVNRESALRHRDGHPIPVLRSVVPLDYPDRSFLLESYVDISELKQAEVALRAAKEVAESAARAKSEFLAKMSHEIRTPMNSIIGMTKLTLDTGLDAEQRENLQIVNASSEALLGLIDDILDFSRIDAGRIELEAIDFDLDHLIEEVLDSFGLRAFEVGIELAYLIDPEVPSRMHGDPGRLRQILVNLIGNALKFTPAGEVVVALSRQPSDRGEVRVRFAVSDTGIGIPQDKQDLIFDAFAQVDNSTRRRYGGTGLGLSICRQLVALMTGEIGLYSRPGEGSEFWFSLPFKPAVQPAPPVVSSAVDLTGIRCLIVDDTKANRMLLEKTLRGWKCESVAVDSGRNALAQLHWANQSGAPYDLVLLDMAMPEMDGEEVALEIRDDPHCGRPRVILLTSVGRRADLERLAALGVSAYLSKPIKRALLRETMLATLGRAATSGIALRPVITDDSLRGFSLAGIKVLLVEDKPFNQKVAERFLEKKQMSVIIAADGLQALEVLRRQHFDVVLMDVQMPVMDGYETTRAIRAAEATDASTEPLHLPVIGMTAYALAGDRERCLAAGMDDYVPKPIDPERLYAAIRTWTAPLRERGVAGRALHHASGANRSGQSQATPVKPSPSAATDHSHPLDPDLLLARVRSIFGEDQDALQGIFRIFLDDVPADIDRLGAAIAAADGAAVTSLAHSIKGMLRNFGLAWLGDRFQEIEEQGRRGAMDSASLLLEQARLGLEQVYAILRDQSVP